MRIDAIVIDKNMPEFANGRIVDIDGKRVILLRSKAQVVWPRWWNKFGYKIGWMWLARLKTKRNQFMA